MVHPCVRFPGDRDYFCTELTLWSSSSPQNFYNLTSHREQETRTGLCKMCINWFCKLFSLSLEKVKSRFFSIQTLNFPSLQKLQCSCACYIGKNAHNLASCYLMRIILQHHPLSVLPDFSLLNCKCVLMSSVKFPELPFFWRKGVCLSRCKLNFLLLCLFYRVWHFHIADSFQLLVT